MPTSRRNSMAESCEVHVEVVLDDRAGRRAVEVDEPLELTPDPVGPLRDGVRGVQPAFARVARIADHARRAAGQHDRPVSGALEPPQCQQRHQVSGVQARRGRVETRRRRSSGPRPARRPVRRRSVDCAISSRHCNSSRMVLPMTMIFTHRRGAAPWHPGTRAPVSQSAQSLSPAPARADCVDRPTPRGGRAARTAMADPRPC